MNKEFWLDKWQKGHIGFHAPEPNRFLKKHFDKLALPEGSNIFVPLCGKSLDIHYLLTNGFKVTGVEFAEQAVQELFTELGVEPEIAEMPDHLEYRHEDITVFTGDIFHLSRQLIGSVDGIYDRASLVALPYEMRIKYTEQLINITEGAKQLLITFHYEQSLMQGPPFSIDENEVMRHYSSSYNVEQLESFQMPGGFKTGVPASEDVYLLRRL